MLLTEHLEGESHPAQTSCFSEAELNHIRNINLFRLFSCVINVMCVLCVCLITRVMKWHFNVIYTPFHQ